MRSFKVVEDFERAVAEFSGAKYAVAVNTGTSALFLSLVYRKAGVVTLPARTFVSVPMAVIHSGGTVRFRDYDWRGVYSLCPLDIVDSALRFRRGMYEGGLHCLSFHARKLLNIGEGGMILTDDPQADAWLRKARYSGRGAPYRVEDIDMIGWQCYMTPEKAARGLHLMEYIAPDLPDQVVEYPDLRKCPVFRGMT